MYFTPKKLRKIPSNKGAIKGKAPWSDGNYGTQDHKKIS